MSTQAWIRLLEVQQWLFAEARLLDSRRFDQWLALLDPEVRYRVPSRSFVRQGDVKDFSTWGVDRELDAADGLPLIDEDFDALHARIDRLQTGMAWAETPPSMTRRIVGNVQIIADHGDDGLAVVSNLLLLKTRREERVCFSGERRDLLVPTEGGFRLRERYVVLDEAVLAAGNLSVLF